MSMNHANEFIKEMLENEELRNRIAGMSTEDGLAAAKEMGLDFTTDELKEAGENYELPEEVLNNVSGGDFLSAVKGMFAGMGAGAATGGLIGCIGGPVGCAIGTCIGGAVGIFGGAFYGDKNWE